MFLRTHLAGQWARASRAAETKILAFDSSSSSSDMALERTNERPWRGWSPMTSCAKLENLNVRKSRTKRTVSWKPVLTYNTPTDLLLLQLLLPATGS